MMLFLTSLKEKFFGKNIEELEAQNASLLSCLSRLD